MKAASLPPRSGWVRSATTRNALLTSSRVAPGSRPSTPSAQGRLPAGAAARGAVLGASWGSSCVRGVRGLGQGGSPRRTRTHAPAQRPSISTSLCPAARAACACASSRVRAPPLEASGLRNGSAWGGAIHHAAQKKRRRFVGTMETTPVKRDVEMAQASHSPEARSGLKSGCCLNLTASPQRYREVTSQIQTAPIRERPRA